MVDASPRASKVGQVHPPARLDAAGEEVCTGRTRVDDTDAFCTLLGYLGWGAFVLPARGYWPVVFT